jgi:hypothetical protein
MDALGRPFAAIELPLGALWTDIEIRQAQPSAG